MSCTYKYGKENHYKFQILKYVILIYIKVFEPEIKLESHDR
jgi:hypothetical protein